MSDTFYKEFEDRHRGSRDLVKARLRVYLPFLERLRDHLPHGFTALELGCGRGEWLELLGENGFHVRGVDRDDGMLAECRERNLDVERDDAVAFLRRLPEETEDVISGFHVAEHLPFSELRALVTDAQRVLKPAGLLILETPNPENLVVGANSFYLDPTHERPLPPDLLLFLAEYAGFERATIVRLNEGRAPKGDANLMTVLKGVSPDYAIVAQKTAERQTLQVFDTLFDKQYGTTLETVVETYEQGLNHKLDTIIAEQRKVREVEEEAKAELSKQWSIREKIEKEFVAERELRIHIESQLYKEQERRNQVASELATVYASKSWWVTKPLRWGLRVTKCLCGLPSRMAIALFRWPKYVAQWLLSNAMRFVLRRSRVSERINKWLLCYPRFHAHLSQFARTHIMEDITKTSSLPKHEPDRSANSTNDSILSPHAHEIYIQLKSTIENCRKESH